MAIQMKRFNVGHDLDCPIYDGMYDHQRTCAGGSIEAAQRLNRGICDIAINWAGGLHHAKRAEASGFCYFNDIVLCILELLKVHARVMYVDIDIHHGDGVEEAFLHTDRVLTVSFHKYGDFFPGTGDITDQGVGSGKPYSLNVPLDSGMDDESYKSIFDDVMDRCVQRYRPNAVVLQLGADSLVGDRLGVWNLTLEGHAHCVEYCKRLGIPMVMLGGGGYTLRNVARCWAFETAVALGMQNDMKDELPVTASSALFLNHGSSEPKLRIEAKVGMANLNTKEKLNSLRKKLFERIDQMEIAPGIQLNQEVPKPFFDEERGVLESKIEDETHGGRDFDDDEDVVIMDEITSDTKKATGGRGRWTK